jgi:hypothetical protein
LTNDHKNNRPCPLQAIGRGDGSVQLCGLGVLTIASFSLAGMFVLSFHPTIPVVRSQGLFHLPKTIQVCPNFFKMSEKHCVRRELIVPYAT